MRPASGAVGRARFETMLFTGRGLPWPPRRRETQFSRAETKTSKRSLQSNRQIAEIKCVHKSPPIRGRFALNWEISVCAGLRGGPGRTRTFNQAIIIALN